MRLRRRPKANAANAANAEHCKWPGFKNAEAKLINADAIAQDEARSCLGSGWL